MRNGQGWELLLWVGGVGRGGRVGRRVGLGEAWGLYQNTLQVFACLGLEQDVWKEIGVMSGSLRGFRASQEG